MAALEDKAKEYVDSDLVTEDNAKAMLDVIRAERGESGVINDTVSDDEISVNHVGLSHRLTRDEMVLLLAKRIELMRAGGNDEFPTDQYRVFTYIVDSIENASSPLRLMIQASAGTGKSFLCGFYI